METYKVALSAGDGIGEELVLQSKKILKALEQRFGVSFEILDILSCGPAIDVYGTALRDEDIEAALGCRAILFGNIGDAQKVSDDPRASIRKIVLSSFAGAAWHWSCRFLLHQFIKRYKTD